MITAFFDIDHTIVCNSSMERIFFKYLWGRRHITPLDVLCTLTFMSSHLFDPTGIAIRSRRPWLQGKSVVQIETTAVSCFKEAILPLISKEAMAKIRRHKEAGHHIILLSGTLEVLARLLSQHLKADEHVACKPEEEGGYFTGNIISPVPYGKGKQQILMSYAVEQGIDLKQSFAYGDSMADIAVFESVGNPCVVNPCRRLWTIAKERGWEIKKW